MYCYYVPSSLILLGNCFFVCLFFHFREIWFWIQCCHQMQMLWQPCRHIRCTRQTLWWFIHRHNCTTFFWLHLFGSWKRCLSECKREKIRSRTTHPGEQACPWKVLEANKKKTQPRSLLQWNLVGKRKAASRIDGRSEVIWLTNCAVFASAAAFRFLQTMDKH